MTMRGAESNIGTVKRCTPRFTEKMMMMVEHGAMARTGHCIAPP